MGPEVGGYSQSLTKAHPLERSYDFSFSSCMVSVSLAISGSELFLPLCASVCVYKVGVTIVPVPQIYVEDQPKQCIWKPWDSAWHGREMVNKYLFLFLQYSVPFLTMRIQMHPLEVGFLTIMITVCHCLEWGSQPASTAVVRAFDTMKSLVIFPIKKAWHLSFRICWLQWET